MKFIIATIVFASALGLISCRNRCEAQEDCEDTECCIISGDRPYRRGYCTSLSAEGKPCSEPESRLEYYGNKFYKYCPCQGHLECHPKDVNKIDKKGSSFFEKLRCQLVGTGEPPLKTTDSSSSSSSSEEHYTRTTRERRFTTGESEITDGGEITDDEGISVTLA